MMGINEQNTRILPSFQLHYPETISEAACLLMDPKAVALAGGTDLIPKMKEAVIRPTHVISLKRIPGLSGVTESGDIIEIGALTKLRDLERSDIVESKVPLLHEAVSAIGSVQIRNMATIGGNLCNASPAADSSQALIALCAVAVIVGMGGERSLPLENFFVGPGKTSLKSGEILKALIVPTPSIGSRSCFIKVGRTALDLASVSIAVQARIKGNRVESIRVVMGAVAPMPLRIGRVEGYLIGKRLTDGVIEEAANMVFSEIMPITDIRGTAEYRRLLARGLTREALIRVRGG